MFDIRLDGLWLGQEKGSYRKPYDDNTNIKMTDLKRTIWDKIAEPLTAKPTMKRFNFLILSDAHILKTILYQRILHTFAFALTHEPPLTINLTPYV